MCAKVDFSKITFAPGVRETNKVYLGLASCLEFNVYMELGDPDYRKTVYEDGDLLIQLASKKLKLYLVIEKTPDGKEGNVRAMCIAPEAFDSPGRFYLTSPKGAAIYDRFAEKLDGSIIELLDKDGEVLRVLHSYQDGRFVERTEEDGRIVETDWEPAVLLKYEQDEETPIFIQMAGFFQK